MSIAVRPNFASIFREILSGLSERDASAHYVNYSPREKHRENAIIPKNAVLDEFC